MSRPRVRPIFGLALLAYVPALLSSPGRVPGDTKLSLYLDPIRLISDSIWTWDSRQFSGWVPHQNVGYLWPSGPFYAFFDALSIPDWIAHRLWIGTLLFAAGAGIVRLGRVLGVASTVAVVAAVVYQTSPYVLPYISRTSALLLPWSLLGWIVATAVLVARHRRSRDVAVWTLLIASTGGLNATALVMIAPAPLVFALAENRWRSWRHSARTLVLLAGSAGLASAWWMAGLMTQGRFGAAVLSYSEALPSTAATSTSLEVLRGLGYWLFYDRNVATPLTTAADPYMTNWFVMVAGLTLVVIGLLGLRTLPATLRRPMALLLVVAVVLAVGAHPFDDPSPLWSFSVDNPTSALSLALRSSTRAAPLVVLVLAFGAGAFSERARTYVTSRSPGSRRARFVPLVVCLVALVNAPSLVSARLVDPAVDRPESVPAAWYEAARFLDDRLELGHDGAVLLLPGVESAAYRWGYPVDPVLPTLTSKRFVSRDWLPLGSAPYMDALYAVDDAAQESRLDPDAIAPLARLLGADTVMIVSSVEYERFGTVRAERFRRSLGDSPAGLTHLADFGPPTINRSDRFWSTDDVLAPAVPLPEIVLWAVDDPSPPTRVSESPVVVVGGGTGLVDATSIGLVDGHDVILDLATVDDLGTGDAVVPSRVVVTDAGRRRAHHWRSSQEVWGATESDRKVVTTDDVFDQRLVDTVGAPGETTIRSESIEAQATAYGTELSYWPEHRPSMALDDDPSTAWRVGDERDPRGHTITVTSERPLDSLTLERTTGQDRWITAVDVRADSGTWRRHVLSDRTDIELERGARVVDVRIAEIAWRDSASATTGAAVGFAEILPDELRRPEVVEISPLDDVSIDAFVFTRLVADPIDGWRDDPERRIIRSFSTSATMTVDPIVSARLSTRATDDVVADLLGIDAPTSPGLSGHRAWNGWSAFDGDPTTSWWSPLGDRQPTLVVPIIPGTDRLTIVQPSNSPRITRVLVSGSDGIERDVTLRSDGVIEFDPFVGSSAIIRVLDVERVVSTDRRTGRSIDLPVGVTEVTGAVIVDVDRTVETSCRDDLIRLDGRPLAVRLTGRVDRLLDGEAFDVTSCDDTRDLEPGSHILDTASELDTAIAIDRVALVDRSIEPPSTATAVAVESSRASRTFTVPACDTSCVVESSDGWNTGWSGDPLPSASGRNAWILESSATPRTFRTSWTPQVLMWLGLALSGVTLLVATSILLVSRRRTPLDPPSLPANESTARSIRFDVLSTVTVMAVVALVVSPSFALLPALVGLAAASRRSTRRRVLHAISAVGLALVVLGLLFVIAQSIRTGADSGFGWPSVFSRAHRPTLTGLVMWGLGLAMAGDSLRRS